MAVLAAIAAGLMRTLPTCDRTTNLAHVLLELGRLIKTLYLLRFINGESYRRRIIVQLNRGETTTGLLAWSSTTSVSNFANAIETAGRADHAGALSMARKALLAGADGGWINGQTLRANGGMA